MEKFVEEDDCRTPSGCIFLLEHFLPQVNYEVDKVKGKESRREQEARKAKRSKQIKRRMKRMMLD
eukprot:scaffold2042_cov175-Ochromonas_danica.AAC.9